MNLNTQGYNKESWTKSRIFCQAATYLKHCFLCLIDCSPTELKLALRSHHCFTYFESLHCPPRKFSKKHLHFSHAALRIWETPPEHFQSHHNIFLQNNYKEVNQRFAEHTFWSIQFNSAPNCSYPMPYSFRLQTPRKKQGFLLCIYRT